MLHNISKAVDQFLLLAKAGPTISCDIGEMAKQLDELAWLTHRVQFQFDEAEYPEPPEINAKESFIEAERWFQIPEDKSYSNDFSFFDAALDLSEIMDDLAEIQWRFKNTSVDDALFHYQLGYQSHWGHHMRSLQKFIHGWYW